MLFSRATMRQNSTNATLISSADSYRVWLVQPVNTCVRLQGFPSRMFHLFKKDFHRFVRVVWWGYGVTFRISDILIGTPSLPLHLILPSLSVKFIVFCQSEIACIPLPSEYLRVLSTGYHVPNMWLALAQLYLISTFSLQTRWWSRNRTHSPSSLSLALGATAPARFLAHW